MRRRVWCETLSYHELTTGPIAGTLQRYRVDLLLAVRPWHLDQAADVVRRFQDSGVAVAVWPMLPDAEGRWANAANHATFIAFCDRVLAHVPFADELIVDLEPSIADLARWKTRRLAKPSPRSRYRLVSADLAAAVARWRQVMRVTTAVLPLLALEFRGQWLQWLLGTPMSKLAADRHSMMAYTSLFEGWSRGVVNRSRAEALLVACARSARFRLGDRATISLGTVGPGAFGDEPSYRGPFELRRDVELARAEGIDELSLFDLGGIVRRGPIEPWFEALCAP